MATATVAPRRPGNPNFGKRKSEDQKLSEDLNKQYIFQLLKEHHRSKPITSKFGEAGGEIESPYQPYYGAVNSGLAWDPEYVPKGKTTKGGTRRWRFLYGYPSIWVDEQVDPEPSKEDLISDRNDLKFRNGVLRVFGHEQTKLQALMLNDAFSGCVRKLKNIPAEYQLLDQDKIDKEVLEAIDDAFEAEKAAREATIEEMYAVGMFFGLDMTKSDDAIRKQFIVKARTNPSLFNREFLNPKNKYKYFFKIAVDDNYISGTMVPGKLQLVEANTPILDLKTEDVAEECAMLAMGNDSKALALYDKLVKKYRGE